MIPFDSSEMRKWESKRESNYFTDSKSLIIEKAQKVDSREMSPYDFPVRLSQLISLLIF